MITVHHLADSRSQRVLWLLEELDLDYEVVRYERDPATYLAPASLKRVHPLGKSPVITDDDNTVAETGHIVDYIVRRHGQGRLAPAADSLVYERYQYWLHYAEGSLMPPLLLQLIFNSVETRAPMLAKPVAKAISGQVKKQFIRPQQKLHFDYLEDQLADNDWFVGEAFTAADIMLSFPIEAGTARGVVRDSHPRLKAFIERIHGREAYKRALARGGEYAYA
ncbi:glutathione S-transferase [Salinisphaera japonica]|uniref:glutathione transferase n=1 Tax=Salinisphaera japonica YTM-1 TaxID=1209778 RepID=A0A423Q174_9GAMM|nr:glutathione S-transferase [Salinisphaera japonica]ROO31904.1 glutathione S-transferase [Salinisphaera japonica YTM-1]